MITGQLGAEEPTAVTPIENLGGIEVLDPAALELIDADAPVELLATGFRWSEGPLWIAEGGYLIFSDIPRNTVYRWKDGDGLSIYLRPAGYTGPKSRGGESGSNGLAIDGQGRLILCQHGDHRVARMDAPILSPESKFTTIASDYQGSALNSPNDLAIHSSGAIYFTDPPYGREGNFDATDRELDFQGVYRVEPGKPAQLLTKALRAPNGIVFSPDEKTMYVAQSDPKRPIYMAYRLADDGGIDEGRVLFDSTAVYEKTPGNPDGIKVDENGVLFATGPGGVLLISPEGKHLATIGTGERVANCAFGDDGRTLYMTSHQNLCRVRLKTKGLGF